MKVFGYVIIKEEMLNEAIDRLEESVIATAKNDTRPSWAQIVQDRNEALYMRERIAEQDKKTTKLINMLQIRGVKKSINRRSRVEYAQI